MSYTPFDTSFINHPIARAIMVSIIFIVVFYEPIRSFFGKKKK